MLVTVDANIKFIYVDVKKVRGQYTSLSYSGT